MSVLVLASASEIRAKLLTNAGLSIEISPAAIDEAAIRASLEHEGATPREIAAELASLKAQRASARHPGKLVLGCDQLLDLGGEILSKPASPQDAVAQLSRLRGQRHRLSSAAVLFLDGQPIWRTVATADLLMRPFSDAFLQSYVAAHWQSIRHSVGCYQLESAGIRLFERIEGDYFVILGLPLLDLLNFLTIRGDLDA